MLVTNTRKKKPALDTNTIIRFLTRDIKIQAVKVRSLLEHAQTRSLEIPDLIIAEIVYVLESNYELSKSEIVDKLSLLIKFKAIKTNQKILMRALDFYLNNNLSFPDAYLCSLVYFRKNPFLYTFDKHLLKLKNIKSQQP